MQRAAAERFIGTGLELGGCDPAYVRHDANLAHAVENLVDGAYFNSGQSCCGIQRIYVHERVYDAFVDGFVDLTRKYVLGNPLEAGDDARPGRAHGRGRHDPRSRSPPRSTRARKPVIDEAEFPASRAGTPYLAPQVLLDVDHSMPVMREEIFGPVAGIMKVQLRRGGHRADERQRLRPDRRDLDRGRGRALSIGDRVETGTWFMNRCDYLDPALAWVGVKDSGRGCTLSRRRLRAPDAAEVVPPANADLSDDRDDHVYAATGTIRPRSASAPGASRSCPMRARRCGIARPLLVTDPGARRSCR